MRCGVGLLVDVSSIWVLETVAFVHGRILIFAIRIEGGWEILEVCTRKEAGGQTRPHLFRNTLSWMQTRHRLIPEA